MNKYDDDDDDDQFNKRTMLFANRYAQRSPTAASSFCWAKTPETQ